MNPVISKIVSLPINCSRDNAEGSMKSVNGPLNFLASIEESLSLSRKMPFHESTELVQEGKDLEKRYKFYIESLRKRLLAKGKPLNKISLNSKDLFVLKKFLSQCGFSKEKVDGLLQELAENNPKGEIDLSLFFRKVAELESSKGKSDQPVSLDISAIPYVESLLKDFGLSQKELDNAFSSARLKGGKLDLTKFLIELKKVSGQIKQRDPDKNHLTVDRNIFLKVFKKLEGAGIRIPEKETGGRVSLKDLIAALEQITGGEVEGGQLPGDVKTAIDQIVERVAVPAEKEGLASSLLSFSKLRLNALHPNEKAGKKANTIEKSNFLSILEKNNKTTENEDILALLKKNSVMNAEKVQEKAERPSLSKSAKLLSSPDVSPDIAGSTFTDTINNAKNQPKIARDLLPAYLINQVGRQISRSILKGESVFKLQLHPPELGGMKVDMDIKDNILKLGVIIENSSVKELLLSNAHELRQALVEQGVKLDKLNIQISYNSGQSLNNSKGSSKQNQRWGKGTNSISLIGENGSEQPQSMQRFMLGSDRLLDLTA